MKYQDKIESFYNDFCSIENGKASQYIGDYIYKDIEKNHKLKVESTRAVNLTLVLSIVLFKNLYFLEHYLMV